MSYSLNSKSFAPLLATLVFCCICACDEDPMRQGAQALYNGELALAEKSFNQALAQDESNFEAKRRLADVAMMRKDYAEAEKILVEIFAKLPAPSRRTTLTIEQQVFRNLLTEQFTQLYVSWLPTLDRNADAETFRHVLTEGIKFAPSESQLNLAAVTYYTHLADQFVHDGKDLLAIENYRTALTFNASAEIRNEIEGKIAKSKRTAFEKTFARQFEGVKAEFQPPYSWNEEQNAVEITIEYTLDWRRRDVDAQTIKNEVQPQIETAIRRLMSLVYTLPSEFDTAELFMPKYSYGEVETKKRTTYVQIFVSPAELSSAIYLSISKFDMKEKETNSDELPKIEPLEDSK